MPVAAARRDLRTNVSCSRIALTIIATVLASASVASAQVIGPDVIVTEIGQIQKWGNLFGMTAYSVSTTSCNIGDDVASWYETTNEHPLIASNMYRYENGRLQQLAMSWVKHGFCALDDIACGPCQATSDCSLFGVSCSDTYGAGLNGLQAGLGARSDINPATGDFVYPFPTIGLTGPVLYKRMQVVDSMLSPSSHPTAKFYTEVQYIHFEEPAWGTQYNDVSYREFTVGAYDSGYELAHVGSVAQQTPAIYAWQENDPEVEIEELTVTDDGRFYAGGRASDLGSGWWHYEFALYNMNSDRAAGSFAISLPVGANVDNLDFVDIAYHSGELYAGTDWTATVYANRVEWQSDAYSADANANALRWGTLYNFAFDCDVAPDTSALTVGLFKPGSGSVIDTTIVGPGQSPCSTPDFVRGNVNGDGVVDISDVVYTLEYLFQLGDPPIPTPLAADVNGDGSEDISDAVYLLAFLFTSGPPPPYPYPDPGCL